MSPLRPVRTITGSRGSKRESIPSASRISRRTSRPGGVGQREVQEQQVGVVVAAEAERVGGAGRRHHAEAVGGEVLAEQVEGDVVVLADDEAGDLFSLGKHGAPKSRARANSPPCGEGISNTAAAPRCQRTRRGGTRRRTASDPPLARRGRRGRARSASRRCGRWRSAGSAGPARPRRGRGRRGRAGGFGNPLQRGWVGDRAPPRLKPAAGELSPSPRLCR